MIFQIDALKAGFDEVVIRVDDGRKSLLTRYLVFKASMDDLDGKVYA